MGENFTHCEEKKQPIETEPEINQLSVLLHRDFKETGKHIKGILQKDIQLNHLFTYLIIVLGCKFQAKGVGIFIYLCIHKISPVPSPQ